MNEQIPHLNIETLGNGNIRLENESMGDSYCVDLHPMHVRLLAEQIGLIKADPSVKEKGPTLAEQARDIDRLKRNLLRVREHSLQLQHKFATGADWQHADLSFEMGLINTLVDLLDMAVDDFADDFEPRDPQPFAPTAAPKQADKQDTPKKGAHVSGAFDPAKQLEIDDGAA